MVTHPAKQHFNQTHKSTPLRHLHSVHTAISYVSKIHLNVILSCTFGSSSMFPLLQQNYIGISAFSHLLLDLAKPWTAKKKDTFHVFRFQNVSTRKPCA
jgi:hypothetical protein